MYKFTWSNWDVTSGIGVLQQKCCFSFAKLALKLNILYPTEKCRRNKVYDTNTIKKKIETN